VRQAFIVPVTDVLVTKTMLGVFGCVPAFDQYFKLGFGTATFGSRALIKIGDYYERHEAVLDRLQVVRSILRRGTKPTGTVRVRRSLTWSSFRRD
jgi:hypothetical protein